MAEVLLFHHAQGQTDGFHAFADALRRAGHAVHTPDLFEGRTFSSIEEGIAFAEKIGFGEIVERGARAAERLPDELVYAGFSLGVLPAQKLAQTRAGAKGALLFHSCVPTSEFGSWPDGVPAQIHAMEADPFFVGEGDIDAARELVERNGAELFLYPGDAHLFADSSLPDYDERAAALLLERVLAFLRRQDVASSGRMGQAAHVVPEARLERTEHGLIARGEGWYVLNARESEWRAAEGRGAVCDLEGDTPFSQLGFNLFVLGPGEPMSMYHWEADQEDFLVVAGEALLLAEGQERPLRTWDFVHCPPHVSHTIVGAGEGCVVVAVGAREHQEDPDWGAYPVHEVAVRHGAGVEEETNDPRAAYAKVPRRSVTAYRDDWLP